MKKYFLFAAAALALAACSNDDENLNNGPVAAQISAGVSGPTTRAMNDQWEADAIGVMVQKVEGTTAGITSVMADMYKNVKYTTTATTDAAANFSPTGTTGIFFQDANETVTFAAYGPYQTSAANNALPGANGEISTISTTEQNTRDLQKAFDFIFAEGATASRTNFAVEFKETAAFKHKMARLVIVVKPGDDVTIDDFAKPETSFALNGLQHNGTFNVTTGTAAATGDAADWSLSQNSLLATSAEAYTFTSIVYPQTLGSALTFIATIDGQNYSNNADINPALEAGHSYTYTITVKKTGLTVSGCKIENWGNGGSGSGNATM